MALVRGYNLESLWLCLLQNKVEELNQRLRQANDGQFDTMLMKILRRTDAEYILIPVYISTYSTVLYPN